MQNDRVSLRHKRLCFGNCEVARRLDQMLLVEHLKRKASDRSAMNNSYSELPDRLGRSWLPTQHSPKPPTSY